MHMKNTGLPLTERQKMALARLDEIQKSTYYIGVNEKIMTADFHAVNKMRVYDEMRADEIEKMLFLICGYNPPT